MRKLLIRFALWVLDRYGVNLVEARRIPHGGDAVERGARWEAFYNEAGGIREMLALIRAEAFEAAAELPPEDTDKIYYWAMADRNVRKLQNRIERVIASGKAEAARNETVARMTAAAINRNIEF